jgi:hypothetical protein
MSDEDESIDPITAAERGILQLLAGREAKQAFAFDKGAQEDRGTSAVNQLAQDPAPQFQSNKRRAKKNWRQ